MQSDHDRRQYSALSGTIDSRSPVVDWKVGDKLKGGYEGRGKLLNWTEKLGWGVSIFRIVHEMKGTSSNKTTPKMHPSEPASTPLDSEGLFTMLENYGLLPSELIRY